MGLNKYLAVLMVVVVVVAAEMVGNAGAATYVVGDSLGWRVPPGGAADYATWASQHVFRVGDTLVFNFPTGAHDVARVTQAAYSGCSSTSPIALATVGPASFTLNSTGPDFYICTFGQHCALGQILSINVTSAAATSPTPAPTTAPPSPAVMPPSPAVMPPSPSPTPTIPTPTPSPAGAMSPGSSAAPSPGPSGGGGGGGAASPPAPSPGSESGLSPSPGSAAGDITPPPPGNAAALTNIRAPFVVFASIVVFGLVM